MSKGGTAASRCRQKEACDVNRRFGVIVKFSWAHRLSDYAAVMEPSCVIHFDVLDISRLKRISPDSSLMQGAEVMNHNSWNIKTRNVARQALNSIGDTRTIRCEA